MNEYLCPSIPWHETVLAFLLVATWFSAALYMLLKSLAAPDPRDVVPDFTPTKKD